jgi:hypothetical protein
MKMALTLGWSLLSYRIALRLSDAFPQPKVSRVYMIGAIHCLQLALTLMLTWTAKKQALPSVDLHKQTNAAGNA